jgi:hypothetical protein
LVHEGPHGIDGKSETHPREGTAAAGVEDGSAVQSRKSGVKAKLVLKQVKSYVPERKRKAKKGERKRGEKKTATRAQSLDLDESRPPLSVLHPSSLPSYTYCSTLYSCLQQNKSFNSSLLT